MATAKKLPSGKWRCVAYLGTDMNGKKIQKSITADTKSEAEKLCKEFEVKKRTTKKIVDKDISLDQAITLHIEKKIKRMESSGNKKISPSTIRTYTGIQKTLIDDIRDIPCIRFDEDIINNWICNLELKGKSPKTIRNAYSLVHASLLEILPKSTVIDWIIELPELEDKNVFVPSEEDIKTLVDYFKENDYDMYLVCLLASNATLRRSELCALTADDVENNLIYIDKAIVLSADSKSWVTKVTKTKKSTRCIEMPKEVIKLFPKDGNIVKLNPTQVSKRFERARNTLPIDNRITLHCLRHYSASIMSELGISDEVIKKRGGWSNNYTLNKHYRGSIDEYEKISTNKVNNHFVKKFM